YHYCPDVDFPWRWFSPGSVLFTLGFGATTVGFSYYVARFGSFDKTYGSLGAVIILLVWMYLLALFMLLGGEVNAYLDRQAEAEAADPVQARRAGGQRPEADPWRRQRATASAKRRRSSALWPGFRSGWFSFRNRRHAARNFVRVTFWGSRSRRRSFSGCFARGSFERAARAAGRRVRGRGSDQRSAMSSHQRKSRTTSA